MANSMVQPPNQSLNFLNFIDSREPQSCRLERRQGSRCWCGIAGYLSTWKLLIQPQGPDTKCSRGPALSNLSICSLAVLRAFVQRMQFENNAWLFVDGFNNDFNIYVDVLVKTTMMVKSNRSSFSLYLSRFYNIRHVHVPWISTLSPRRALIGFSLFRDLIQY